MWIQIYNSQLAHSYRPISLLFMNKIKCSVSAWQKKKKSEMMSNSTLNFNFNMTCFPFIPLKIEMYSGVDQVEKTE